MRTLLLLGAAAQAVLFAILPYRLALVPALGFAVHSAITTLAHCLSPAESPFTRRVAPGRTIAQIPSWYTGYFSSLAAPSLVVFHLVVTFNHPLGARCPGGKEAERHLVAMEDELSRRREEFGLLGLSRWRGTTREAHNALLVVMYFRNLAGLARFAQAEEHGAALDAMRQWGERNADGRRCVSVVHETFEVPPTKWDAVYWDAEPTLLGDGSCRVLDGNGKLVWLKTLAWGGEAGARMGLLGRLGRAQSRSK